MKEIQTAKNKNKQTKNGTNQPNKKTTRTEKIVSLILRMISYRYGFGTVSPPVSFPKHKSSSPNSKAYYARPHWFLSLKKINQPPNNLQRSWYENYFYWLIDWLRASVWVSGLQSRGKSRLRAGEHFHHSEGCLGDSQPSWPNLFRGGVALGSPRLLTVVKDIFHNLPVAGFSCVVKEWTVVWSLNEQAASIFIAFY